jgi:hypothetical protein
MPMADWHVALTLILLGIAFLLISPVFLSSNPGIGALFLLVGLGFIIGGGWILFKRDDRVRGRHF